MTTSQPAHTTESPVQAVLAADPPPQRRRRRSGASALRPLTPGEQVFRVVNVIILSGFALLCAIPFVHVIGSSFATPGELATSNFLLIPREVTLDAYRYILSTPTIFRAMGVSTIVTLGGTFLSLLVTALMAYALAKPRLVGRRAVNFMVVFTMLFSGGMIPTFIVVSKLGLLDSLWSLVLPVLINAFNFVIMRNFFSGIPESLEESARIDGCSELGVFARIVLPLSIASIATIGLFYGVTYWNTYMHAVLYINDSTKWPIQVLLRQIVIVSSGVNADASAVDVVPPAQSVKMAVIAVATLPMLMVYPFIQRFFVKGALIGSVKG